MPFPLAVNARISIPESAVETRFVRSSGPGGQSVNKVASKVQMWIDLDRLVGATPGDLALIRMKLATRLDAAGRLMVSSQTTREQGRNLAEAAVRAADLIRSALIRMKLATRLDAAGRLMVSSQTTREQGRNLAEAAVRAADLIRAALIRPKVRRATRPTGASKERRLEEKRRRAGKLRHRHIDPE